MEISALNSILFDQLKTQMAQQEDQQEKAAQDLKKALVTKTNSLEKRSELAGDFIRLVAAAELPFVENGEDCTTHSSIRDFQCGSK